MNSDNSAISAIEVKNNAGRVVVERDKAFDDFCRVVRSRVADRLGTEFERSVAYPVVYFEEALNAVMGETESCIASGLVYDLVDERMKGSTGLLVIGLDSLGYFHHVLKHRSFSMRMALAIPPHHASMFIGESVSRVTSSHGCLLSGKAWDEGVRLAAVLSEVLKVGLEPTDISFEGLVVDGAHLLEMSASSPINQIRSAFGDVKCDRPWHPLVNVFDDELLRVSQDAMNGGVNVVIWDNIHANTLGYDFSCIAPEYREEWCDANLSEVIQLPDDVGCWLFVWDSGYCGPVKMIDARDVKRPRIVEVYTVDLKRHGNYTPSYYLEKDRDHENLALKALSKRIQRGTTVKGADLGISGTVHEMRVGSRPIEAGAFESETSDCRGFYCDDDFWYVDNAAIQGREVTPRLISEIPPRQERYTVSPEDGPVILVTRDGRGVVLYRATCPTLISNNIYIIYPNLDLVNPDYLVLALRSSWIHQQMEIRGFPLSKTDIAELRIPMATEGEMNRVVERDRNVMRKIAEIVGELERLRSIDPLSVLQC